VRFEDSVNEFSERDNAMSKTVKPDNNGRKARSERRRKR